MNGNEPLFRVAEEVEYLLARRRLRAQEHPRLVVVHGHHRPGTICLAGESIEEVHLSYPEREIPIPVRLSLSGLMLCDCMIRFRHTSLSIARMDRILTADPFYRRLGANSFERIEEPPTLARAALRVYIARLREQIAKALKEGGSVLAAENVLLSEKTDSNVAVYRINLPVQVVHRTTKLT
jgi:hypothetical protein